MRKIFLMKMMKMFCKGEIILYDWNYKVLVSGFYESKREAVMLYDNWLGRYKSQAHHFIIKPVPSLFSKPKKIIYKNKNGYIEKVRNKEPIFIPYEKHQIIRPLAQYNNNKSPFGISDKLHKKNLT